MKDTGIIRRVDELGRLVIPKEIRKHLRIRDGDPVEIFINAEGQIILKKHALFEGLFQSVDSLAKTLSEATQNTILVCDITKVIACGGKSSRIFDNKELTNRFISLIEGRRPLDINANEIIAAAGVDYQCRVYPLIARGDLFGAVVVVEDSRQLLGNDVHLVQTMNKFLTRQLEL